MINLNDWLQQTNLVFSHYYRIGVLLFMRCRRYSALIHSYIFEKQGKIQNIGILLNRARLINFFIFINQNKYFPFIAFQNFPKYKNISIIILAFISLSKKRMDHNLPPFILSFLSFPFT